jgi:hypothetical protein
LPAAEIRETEAADELAMTVTAIEVPAVSEPTLAAAAATLPAEVPSPPSESDDYESHYVLFPKGLHWDWYEACRFYFERFGPTRGEELRDAARADVITCINPSQETLDTLRRLNPSARLDVIRADAPADLSALIGQRILSGKAYGE